MDRSRSFDRRLDLGSAAAPAADAVDPESVRAVALAAAVAVVVESAPAAPPAWQHLSFAARCSASSECSGQMPFLQRFQSRLPERRTRGCFLHLSGAFQPPIAAAFGANYAAGSCREIVTDCIPPWLHQHA